MIGSEKKLLMYQQVFLLTYQIGGVLGFPRKHNPFVTNNVLCIIVGYIIGTSADKHTTSCNFVYVLVSLEMIKKKVKCFTVSAMSSIKSTSPYKYGEQL